MRRKRPKELRTHKVTIRLNSWELEMIERGIHIQGMKSGWFTSVASFIRGNAVAKAHNLILQWQKRPKVERDKIEAEYGEITDDQDAA